MRKVILFIIMSLSSIAFAKGADSKGLYIVPTPPEYVEHSRFEVEIVNPYQGPGTKKLGYIFPEILAGEKGRLIEFYPVSPDAPNRWESEQITADCSVLDDNYICNITFKKLQAFTSVLDLFIPRLYAEGPLLSKEKSLNHLQTLGLSAQEQQAFSVVVDQWFSNEPGGILIYDF